MQIQSNHEFFDGHLADKYPRLCFHFGVKLSSGAIAGDRMENGARH